MSWFKQKSIGTTPGMTDHAKLTNLEYDKSGHIGFQRQVSVWTTGLQYHVNDLVTNNGVLYRCIIDHTSTALAIDTANWECLTSTSAGGQGVIQRITRLNVTAPKTVDLSGQMGLVQARIFMAGTESTQIDCDFNNIDARDFTIDGQPGELSPNYVWDGTMRPQIVYQSSFPVHRLMDTGMYSESGWIDHSKFKNVEKVEVLNV
ncbi:carbohydrate-binding protein [Pelosinus sp. UFO1]|uniref:carbohydrate-binding protein n=1 Tax=Pelosinus sp. UFO1 TaxID=484770 RepID=UPI0004D14B48|nr:carbohydrate-binding protein [Pelosinus sp. UFO1]AIF54091.1 hypothetical protein UFO1_4556 [Pelosinus sp. UFO1]